VVQKAISSNRQNTALLVEPIDTAKENLDYVHDRNSPVPDVTETEMFLFLAVVIQMGHDT
jgi:hypothetical protein